MRLNAIHHIAVIASDYARAKEFYVEKLIVEEICKKYDRSEKFIRLLLKIWERMILL